MSFGDAYVETSVRHFLHQDIHGASRRHGRGDPYNLVVCLGEFQQSMSEDFLEQRWHTFGVGHEAFARFLVELTGSVPDGGCLFGWLEALALGGVDVQKLGTLHILDVLQYFGQGIHIVSVYGTEITDIHPFEHILLLGEHRLQAVVEADEALPSGVVQNPPLVQHLGNLEAEAVIAFRSLKIQQILFHASNTTVDGHVVVIQDDKQVVGRGRSIVQPFECQTAAHRTVTDDGHDVTFLFTFVLGSYRHAQSSGDGVRGMSTSEGVVFTFLR